MTRSGARRTIHPAALDPAHLQLAQDVLARLQQGESEVRVSPPGRTEFGVRLGIPTEVIQTGDREILARAALESRLFGFSDLSCGAVVEYGLFLSPPGSAAGQDEASERDIAAALLRTSLHRGNRAAGAPNSAEALELLLSARPAIATASDLSGLVRTWASWDLMLAITEFAPCLAVILLEQYVAVS